MKHLRKSLGVSLLLVATAAFAHHGWSEYDATTPLELSGTISQTGYANPHGFIHLKTADKTWTVVLAPPSRMESRGLTQQMLTIDNQATVVGYPNRSRPEELRAERITINGKTVELR
ncbi:hypothetical protein GIV19_13355 [Pseudomonas syringae]|uniref:DUF6152 family protein n=1 Tax=Pseudomonas syringae TaxID=317 RepID=UPI001F40E428|nr:DUF6152 family protein [Pseudomonas syringae]MCF5708274.1 hypothetical protein [Pseudomonas syringae]